jgi:hypothetical protein
MEFKEYGPLAESKELATNKKTSWMPLVVMLGLGVVMGIALINLEKDNQQWNKKDNDNKTGL